MKLSPQDLSDLSSLVFTLQLKQVDMDFADEQRTIPYDRQLFDLVDRQISVLRRILNENCSQATD